MPTPFVITVTGPVPIAALGVTLAHEHLVSDLSRSGYQDSAHTSPAAGLSSVVDDIEEAHAQPLNVDDNLRLDDQDIAVEELRPFRESGGRTVVELTPVDAGRAPVQLRDIAVRSGLQIVMGCGWYRIAGREAARGTN